MLLIVGFNSEFYNSKIFFPKFLTQKKIIFCLFLRHPLCQCEVLRLNRKEVSKSSLFVLLKLSLVKETCRHVVLLGIILWANRELNYIHIQSNPLRHKLLTLLLGLALCLLDRNKKLFAERKEGTNFCSH